MSSKKSRVLPAVLAATMILAGCGGGGADGDASADANESVVSPVVINESVVTASDARRFLITGSFSAPDDVIITQTPDIGIKVAAYSNGVVELVIPDVDRPITTQLQITIVVGGLKVTKELSLLANNVSGDLLVAKAQAAIGQHEALVGLEQDARLYGFFIDYAYLSGVLRHSEKQALLEKFAPLSAPSYPSLQSSLKNVATALESYRAADIGETDLQQAVDLLESALADHSTYGQQRLSEISEYSEVLVPPLGEGTVTFDQELEIWSRYTVNDRYGRVVETEFVVADDYAPIESLIQTTVSQSLTCEVL